MGTRRYIRVLLTALLVFVPAAVGVLASASVESEAAGLPGSQSARGIDSPLLLDPTFTITPSAGPNGTISPDTTQTVTFGADLSFAITPDTGYRVADVLVDGLSVGAVTSYPFTNVTADHTISATFAIDTFTITPSAGANGTIGPSTVQTVSYGVDQTFTFAAARDYYVADVVVDGVSVGPVPSYTFTAVAANHTISVSFALGVQTGLSIDVGNTTVNYGASTLLSGTLFDNRDPLRPIAIGNQDVTVQYASSANGPWTDLETLTTDSVGEFIPVIVTPTAPTYYRLRFAAKAGYGPSLSGVVGVGVRPVLSTPKVPSSVRAGRSFTVYGTLEPQFLAGQKTVKIKAYRYKNRRWVMVKTASATNVDDGNFTKYRLKLRLSTKGKYRFRAYTVATTAWAAASTGLTRTLVVK